MIETPATFPGPGISRTIHDLFIKLPKIYAEMTYLENNNTNEAIRKNPGNKDVYESGMHNIYNLVVGQTNETLQEKSESDATFQAVNTDQY